MSLNPEDIFICKTGDVCECNSKVFTSLTSCLLNISPTVLLGGEMLWNGVVLWTSTLLLLSIVESKMLTRCPPYPVPVGKQLIAVACPVWTPPVSPAPPLLFFLFAVVAFVPFQMAGSHASPPCVAFPYGGLCVASLLSCCISV